MEKKYQQLQPEERLTIASLHLQGSSMRAMARMLGRSPATVSRELAHADGRGIVRTLDEVPFPVARRHAVIDFGRADRMLTMSGICPRRSVPLLRGMRSVRWWRRQAKS
jgi:IS30 family transposase